MTDTRSDKRPSADSRRGNTPFYLLTAGAYAALTIPRMAQAGMFVDGVTYAAISRNLALGIGSFWSPFYTSTVHPQFHEHPPLGFALQAVAFALFGDHLAVERTYSFLFGGLTAILIAVIWRSTIGDAEYDWVPIVFWLLPSTVTWAIVNNILENTQAVFTTMAILAFVRSVQPARASRAWIGWGVLSGLSIVAAALTKGPNGLFPLAAPLIAWVFLRDRRAEALRSAATMLATLAVGLTALLWPQAARTALSTYWNQQVVASVSGVRGAGRWSSLARHLNGGVIMRMGGLLALAWVYARVRHLRTDEDGSRGWRWFFLASALAGSLPVGVSARIAGHYLVPSIPLFALGLASWAVSVLRPALDRWQGSTTVRSIAASLGVLLLGCSFAVPALWGPVEKRDVEWTQEYRSLSSSIPFATTMGTCEAVRADWGLHAYMQRFFRVSLDPEPGRHYRYYLRLTDRQCDPAPACRSLARTRRLAVLECDTGS